MRLEQSFEVPVPVTEAWGVLLDVERAASCMPGATLTGYDGTVFSGTVKVKLGLASLTYRGSGRFVERDEQGKRVEFIASGQDAGGAGGAQTRVVAILHSANAGRTTRVRVVADLDLSGRPARLGRGIIADVGVKFIKQFADCLAQTVARSAAASAPVVPAEPVVSEPVVSEPVTPEPVAPVRVVAEPVAPEAVTVEPAPAPEPVAPEPVAPEPVAPVRVVAEPVAPEAVTHDAAAEPEPESAPESEAAAEPESEPVAAAEVSKTSAPDYHPLALEEPPPPGTYPEPEPVVHAQPTPVAEEPQTVVQPESAYAYRPDPIVQESLSLPQPTAQPSMRARWAPVLIVVGLIVIAAIAWLVVRMTA